MCRKNNNKNKQTNNRPKEEGGAGGGNLFVQYSEARARTQDLPCGRQGSEAEHPCPCFNSKPFHYYR